MDKMLRRYEDLVEEVVNGDKTPGEAYPELDQLVTDLAHARMDLVEQLGTHSMAQLREAITERLTEYRRIEDTITARWEKSTDRHLVREQHDVVREQTASQERAAEASHALTKAANEQTAALVLWTRWLAAATIVLAVATVVLVVVTASSGS